MDYEKAYKEARKRTKIAIARCRTLPLATVMAVEHAISYIFQEPESEDELIRKRLINLIKELAANKLPIQTGGYFVDGQDKKYIAYLEKQKEQQPVEWSEEDERKSLEIKCLIGNYRTGSDGYELCSWIDKIKDRIQPQPKQEWSGEDEVALGDLMWCIEQARKSAKDENDMGNIWFAGNWLENRLKSLRPQPHWKPSEEQMRCLLDCVSKAKEIHNASVGGYDAYRILMSLFNDIENLL